MATNHQIYLAIGSNISPRKKYIFDSLVAIKQTFPENFAVSSLYLTAPFQNLSQPVYYNCCTGFSTALTPQEVLAFCSSLEKKLGRVRDGNKWQSRTIDIDIVLFENEIIKDSDLIIPHYDLENRDFFLIPLLELNSLLVHPVSGKPIEQLLKELPKGKSTNPQKILKPDL